MTEALSAPEKNLPSLPQPAAPGEAAEACATPAAVTAGDAPPQPQAAPREHAATHSRPDAKPRRRARGPRQQAQGERQDAAQSAARAPRAAPAVPPVLDQLADLYPGLFGEVFLPLKRGIFQDLLAAHPEVLDREALKTGLAVHTRSTRYLQSVAAGLKRHDLQGQAVEAMAPEHVHHALLEVFRRRQGRVAEDLRPRLRQRIAQAFEASGLSSEAYGERVRGRDEAANALLDEALAEVAARSAKDEALLRAFEASGAAVEAFADMYGLDPRDAARTLERARQRRAVGIA